MLQNMCLGSNAVDRCVHCEKFQHDFVARTCALIALVQPILHRLSWTNKMIRKAPDHEFRVQWGGSGASVAKQIPMNKFGPFCINFHAGTKRSEINQNKSLFSNGVDRVMRTSLAWVRPY
jgi:hypothetical protein